MPVQASAVVLEEGQSTVSSSAAPLTPRPPSFDSSSIMSKI